jgi:hypothetical protein
VIASWDEEQGPEERKEGSPSDAIPSQSLFDNVDSASVGPGRSSLHTGLGQVEGMAWRKQTKHGDDETKR